ncbi:peptidase inhibitor family I36 protein [Streptomyces albus subsp. chlorinus]|uniref:peptidase inhibitor family I36 protein n=1 Tax=Streptomyces albus TaxID=1888 RepID=UPI0015707C20|nr:peptidase inhibitor family I36 protein [Streptomyces albus]
MKVMHKAGIAFGAGAMVVGGLTTLPAQAAPSDAKVAAYMAEVPNGKKVSDNEVAYEGGKVRVLMSATRASCPSGWYCVWEHSNWRGAMAKWSTTAAHCKKFKFTNYWKNKVSSFWARGGCEDRNYFLKDQKKYRPDPFEYFDGKMAYVRYNDRYDYASKGL